MSSAQKIHAAADPSANDVLNFAEKLSGEDKEASAPSLGLLQLIVLIRKAEAGADDAWTSLVSNQLRHMKCCDDSDAVPDAHVSYLAQ